MSEATKTEEKAPPRAKEAIEKEADEVLKQVGRFSFTVACMEQDLQRMYSKLYTLQQESKDAGPAVSAVPNPPVDESQT